MLRRAVHWINFYQWNLRSTAVESALAFYYTFFFLFFYAFLFVTHWGKNLKYLCLQVNEYAQGFSWKPL